MSKNKFLIYLSACLIVGFQLLLCSCSNSENNYVNPIEHPDLVDQSWLSKQSCPMPCWQGLKPGISLQKDAIAAAKNLPFLGAEKMEPTDAARTSFLCKVPSEKVCLSMRFEHGILSDLGLYPNYLITIDQVVEKLGSPDSFFYSRRDAETKGCSIKVLWIKRQMILGYGEASHNWGDDLCDLIYKGNSKIPKGLSAQEINYLSLERMKMIIETVQEPSTGQNYTLWKGFSE